MKKSWTMLLVLIIVSGCFGVVSADVRINEVELNPEGNDAGYEWVELYSTEEINLTGWTLINNDNDIINLSQNINGYLIINFSSQWLDNSNESVSLFNSSILMDYTDILGDSNNDNKTWQFCSSDWLERNPTPGLENNCSTSQPPTNTLPPEISIEMNWDEDEIINGDGEGFKIEIIVENLNESKNYDVKAWIEFEDNDTKISQTYDENDEWVFSNEYYNDFFENDINESKDIKLRIHEDYEDYYGDAVIYLKIKEEGSSFYKEINEDIEILEPEDGDNDEDNDNEILETKSLPTITGAIIQLGKAKTDEIPETEDIKTENNIIYESKTEQIKKYSIYGFSLLCVGLIVLLSFKKLR